ncbi:ABC transporter permease [Clostridium saccharobutylicum]|uniref:ABC-type transport system, involved in lipoprotein release, permease component n=1 Tax=Clostridium saccharobutylicum DSM 13864 TaxID=1345695 RepID=U5MQM9_CLOSA|nr:FtsX-like permease family protein [Clostridium saccharobutylicum]AGX41966.1 ABC-type transport system, involved in lipoprotein release, permease component [Clostridium saccharobutylicum DSM 13864]AQR89246.1 bacitracin export permease protein BceB [Clostridium saccharobutylicum]AQR99147.1 bacitracin export permease protein BceB [Clostridium saccharobutylicum]AQS13135.1 bacitracin export permease protein BceB [Clostridium saccharobutylicum]MBA2906258.1 putative ABC transport system permease p
MYFKIASGNIKKCYKDYTIYFLTLILAVCIFYSFNSIDSQKALWDIKSSNAKYIEKLMDIISYFSIFVSVILVSLILYANNFLIKKRKKELGIYMTLGMSKRKISRILVTETSIVGAISLIGGLILGIGSAQVLSVSTLKLFDIGMNEYRFAVSISAIGKTILYFGIMFLLVMIFNVFVISRYKIIDLLAADKKNENIKYKNPFIYLASFVLSVVLLAFSYKSILKIGLEPKNTMFILSVAISIAGTVLFFFSLSGAVLYIISKNKKVYFKGLNIFVVKQINSKFNTNFISMSVICFMLFITILILSTGISLKKDFEASLNKIAPFDASIILYANDENNNIEEVLNKIDFKISENEKATTYNEYASAVELKELLSVEDETFEGYFGSFVKISDYNKILKLRGEKEINLKKDEVLILSNYSKLVKPINEKLENNNKVNINGKEYFVKNHEAIQDNLNDFIIEATFCTIVINDEFLPNSKVFKSVINVMYTDKNREENNKKYDQIKNSSIDGEYSSLGIADIDAHSKDSVYSGGKRVTTSELFIGLYLGIVFLITTMAVLALQQLSEASDSIERYKALKRIGASKKMINKTIFIQTLMHFTLPVIMALIHSVIGVAVVNKEIGIYNPIDIRFSALITALIFVVVYIGYFYITYTGYKNIVKNNM